MGAFSHHEALGRAQTAAEIFERLLPDHAFIKAHPDLVTRCDEIASAMGSLYQTIGSLDPEAPAVREGS